MTTREAVSQTSAAGPGGSAATTGVLRTRWIAIGMLILQLTWVFAIPPFRGIDEFDHVYRAAAAARGQVFVAPADATRGTGAWLDVPNDIVRAARPHCQDLPYTHDEDCVGTPDGATTRIASGAGRYHPLFYVLVGLPALPFHGDGAVYAMRIATVLMSWLLFCLAIGATKRWARTPWPMAALALASTPVLVYSGSIVAPNGVELMAGLALWAALLGLLRDPDPPDRYLLVATAVAGAVLVTPRSLGPLWCVLILATVLIATRPPWADMKALARYRSAWITAGTVLVATVMSTVWTLSMHTLNIGQDLEKHISTGRRLHLIFRSEPLWVLQTIAAFPNRNEHTRMPVYACYLVLFFAIVWLGFRHSRRPVRLALAAAIVIPVLVPLASGLNPNTDPGLWQGRYALPYGVGIVMLTGFALDRSKLTLNGRLRVAVLVLFAVAQAIGPADVYHRTTRHRLSDYTHFLHPPILLISATAALGAAVLWWAASAPDDSAGSARRSTAGAEGIPHR